jgi:endonuclease YncB( thermonuclease family)
LFFIIISIIIIRLIFSLTADITDLKEKKPSPFPNKIRPPQGNFEYADVLSDYQICKLPLVKVEHVIDGDTVLVNYNLSSTKVRLACIDAPEDGQEWGQSSKFGLIKLIGGQHIYIEAHGIDTHDRIVATLYVKNNKKAELINVNEKMITLGHAWVMRKYYSFLSQARKNKLNSLERWAKSKNMGLWKSKAAIAPWEYRQSNCPAKIN